MKIKYVKKLALVLSSVLAVFMLSGCGGDGENGMVSQDGLLNDLFPASRPVKGGSYPVAVHAGNTAIVHSHTAPTKTTQPVTHQWTQVSGPTVGLTNTNTPTVSVQTASSHAGATVVLHHTATSGSVSHTTQHVVNVKPTPAPNLHELNVTLSHTDIVNKGESTSFYASVVGGTPPYSYAWKQTNHIGEVENTFKIFAATEKTNAPTLVAPSVKMYEDIEFELTVTDKIGNVKLVDFEIRVTNSDSLAVDISIDSVNYFSNLDAQKHKTIQSLQATCKAKGGLDPYTYEWYYYAPNLPVDFNVEFDIVEMDDKITFTSNSKTGMYAGFQIGCRATDSDGLSKMVVK
jgi:uncharacterized lipoprotein YehR (DUF1307 family)